MIRDREVPGISIGPTFFGVSVPTWFSIPNGKIKPKTLCRVVHFARRWWCCGNHVLHILFSQENGFGLRIQMKVA